MAIVPQFLTKCINHEFFVSNISYGPTDLSLLEWFSKNVIFSSSYNLPSQSAIQKLSISMPRPARQQTNVQLRKGSQELTVLIVDLAQSLEKMSYL